MIAVAPELRYEYILAQLFLNVSLQFLFSSTELRVKSNYQRTTAKHLVKINLISTLQNNSYSSSAPQALLTQCTTEQNSMLKIESDYLPPSLKQNKKPKLRQN